MTRIVAALMAGAFALGLASPMPDGVAVPLCPTEDHVPAVGMCLWDAGTQGNGRGRSFLVYSDGRVEYL